MSSINDKNHTYFDSHYLSEEFQPIGDIPSTTSSPFQDQYYPISMSSIDTDFGPQLVNRQSEWGISASNGVRNKRGFTPFGRSSFSDQNSSRIDFQNLENKGSDIECNESKIEFKIIVKYLENLRENDIIFQNNILKELKQMRELMSDLKNSIQEMPIKFADALTQCLDSVNGRSDSLSVNSEPEIVDFFDKIDITTNDSKEEDNSFVNFCDNSFKESESVKEKSSSSVDKFVFEYNPYLDLEKWLKKD